MKFGRIAEQTCRSCHALYPSSDLDRYLWCPKCNRGLRNRAAISGRLVGVAASLGVALYIAIVVQPSQRYLLLYAVVLGVTYFLTNRIALAVVQGFYRSRGSLPDRDDAGGADGTC